MDYALHIGVQLLLYVGLALSADILIGHLGVVSVCHAAFYGIGAYSTALLGTRVDWPFPAAMCVGVLLAMASSLVVSLPSYRLRRESLVVTTFAFQMVVFGLMNSWMELTHGPLGISGVPDPCSGFLEDARLQGIMVLAVAVAALVVLSSLAIIRSPYGRLLRAIREDEQLCESLGKNVLLARVSAFAVSAGMAASLGSVFAYYYTFVDPTSFTIMESVLIASMVIIGGPGTRSGPVLGAVVLVTLVEALRFVGLPGPMAGSVRQILYAVMLVLLLALRPAGLVGRYAFDRLENR